MNIAHKKDYASALTSSSLFLNYTCDLSKCDLSKLKKIKKLNKFINKLTLVGGVGTVSHEGFHKGTQSNVSESDFGFKGELQYKYNDKLSLYGQAIQTTTYLGYPQSANIFNFGIKYNIPK